MGLGGRVLRFGKGMAGRLEEGVNQELLLTVC
jgi:hypothetical protein